MEFDHVRFGYNPEKIIINDFSAQVQPGQMVAIVGPTGAGKTTMVKLLMRFYDVNRRAIRVDGHNVRDFNRSELREAFGMVLQDTWLFKGTIMENIRYGRLDATDEEVMAAAKAAHVHHFIQTLPAAIQMELNEDATNISQGQKQLLTIARAILADNKILILDEATSCVDTRTEHLIQKAMNNLMKGRTSFVIAHRLSTIKDADLIPCHEGRRHCGAGHPRSAPGPGRLLRRPPIIPSSRTRAEKKAEERARRDCSAACHADFIGVFASTGAALLPVPPPVTPSKRPPPPG